MWKPPKGKYPIGWDDIKEVVEQIADYKCEICSKKPDNYKKNFNPTAWDNVTTQHFRVHHIDQNKSNNCLTNLQYLCQSCHGELHRRINGIPSNHLDKARKTVTK